MDGLSAFLKRGAQDGQGAQPDHDRKGGCEQPHRHARDLQATLRMIEVLHDQTPFLTG